MAKKPQKSRIALIVMALAVLLTAGFLLGAASPGSQEDPLVTQSWVDSYVDKECDKLEARIDSLSSALGNKNQLCLWIGKTTITKNGVKSTIDVAPQLTNNRTYLPLRYVGEAMGAEFKWNGTEKKVTYLKGNITIELWIGKNFVEVNNKKVTIDSAPTISNGRTMVPIRFVMENLGAELKWDNTEKKVTIIY